MACSFYNYQSLVNLLVNFVKRKSLPFPNYSLSMILFSVNFVIYSTYTICCLLDFPLNRWDTLQISRNLSPQPWCNTTLMRSHFLSGIKITLRHFAQSVNVWTTENTHELLVITSQVSLYPCICYITLIEISKRRVREIWS